MTRNELDHTDGGQFFTEKNVLQMAMRYDPKCQTQLAAFSCGTGPDGENELVAVVDDHGLKKVVREVGSTEPDVILSICPRVTGQVVAKALGISPRGILVQRIDWHRLLWFYDTEAGSALRVPDVA